MKTHAVSQLARRLAFLVPLALATAVAAAEVPPPPHPLPPPPTSLKDTPVPPVDGLERYVRNRTAAIALGKALFWDAQVGSDGQACASCHFHAGADNRLRNQLNPGGRSTPADSVFSPMFGGAGGPNYTLTAADFPLHRLLDPLNRNSPVLLPDGSTTTDPFAGINDVVSSQGTFGGDFTRFLRLGREQCGARAADEFHVGGLLTRRVAPRNTPSVINAVFNFRNFWDGRANNRFNGVNPFGPRDTGARILEVQADGSVSAVAIDLRNASLASQAVGPALNDFEMSCAAKSFHELGRKILTLRPLANQEVHPYDSTLAPLRHPSGRGLGTTYDALIRQAFNPAYWGSRERFDGYTQMEANFSLFWGLAIQLYESTLVSDETPYDKFVGDLRHAPQPSALTEQQQRGFALFMTKGKCIACHKGAEFTGAAVSQTAGGEGTVERMLMNDAQPALYDNGFYNIGVRPTKEDVGVGGKDPFGNPLSYTRQYAAAGFPGPDVQIQPDRFKVDPCTFAVPMESGIECETPSPGSRIAVDGSFKTPSLRNVSLTAPYFHNGGKLTLEQVVEFYNRGGDSRSTDSNGRGDTSGFDNEPSNLDADVTRLDLTPEEQADLVAFVRYGLTDYRVACEKGPFDHPSLRLPNGHKVDGSGALVDANGDGLADDDYIDLPAVGVGGLAQCHAADDRSEVPAVLVNEPPRANPDGITAMLGQRIVVDVTANDVDPDGRIDRATVVLTQPTTGASVRTDASGLVLVTPTVAGVHQFTYHVSDNRGAPSNETVVTVNVLPAEAIAVTGATFNRATRTWSISGTSSARQRQTLTVRLAPNGASIGTAVVAASGTWSLNATLPTGSAAAPAAAGSLQISSSIGGAAGAPFNVR